MTLDDLYRLGGLRAVFEVGAVQGAADAQAKLHRMKRLCKPRFEAMRAELADFEELFGLQRTRTIEASRRWQQAHDEVEVWPDLGDLLAWLLASFDEMMDAKQVLQYAGMCRFMDKDGNAIPFSESIEEVLAHFDRTQAHTTMFRKRIEAMEAKNVRMKRLCKARFEALHKTIRSLVAKREDMVERSLYDLRVKLLLARIHELDRRISEFKGGAHFAFHDWTPYKDFSEGGHE